MSKTKPDLATVDLDNCDQEPIHIPGSIQSHGALFALDDRGRLSWTSRNLREFLTSVPSPADPGSKDPGAAQATASEATASALEYTKFVDNDRLVAAIDELRAQLASDGELVGQREITRMITDVEFSGRICDAILHVEGGMLIVELEQRIRGGGAISDFSMVAHHGIGRLRSLGREDRLLKETVALVSRLTGFDRVMAYRFDETGSGEVMAEEAADGLIPYLGLHFPAADIPAQARRLYTRNTLRFIADVDDPQVPLDPVDPASPALDLSSAVLRSVSPIHLEYLRNIDVAASMSISIIVEGRLWGLVACHHRSPRHVPGGIRLACDALAHVLSSSLDVIAQRERTERRAAAGDVVLRLQDAASRAETERVPPDEGLASSVRAAIDCDGVLCMLGSQLQSSSLPRDVSLRLMGWLDSMESDFQVLDSLDSLPDELREALAPMAGLMAMRFDARRRSWCVLLREEFRDSVMWSGPHAKAMRIGPLGSRLTAHGSLALWREEVQGRCRPWTDQDIQKGRHILAELARSMGVHHAQLDIAREHLLGMLGHDLRDPINSISLAAQLLERGADREAIGKRIAATTERMGRLVGQIVDMGRIESGLGLGLQPQATDVVNLVRSIVDEARLADVHARLELELADALEAAVDQTRFAQLASNLISNARHHGERGEPVLIRLRVLDRSGSPSLRFEVANRSAPLSPDVVETMFNPVKPRSTGNPRNPGGTGLGLYIAKRVAIEHGGTLEYLHDGERVVFRFEMPLRA